jgi:phosphopantothenoylcysteine decarboxylase/phosphopantothenate--cysteine ligase
MNRVVFGVSGGIAAYKACEVLRGIKETLGSSVDVTVVPTRAALEFVGEATWAALSGNPVHTDVFDDVHDVLHVRLGKEADLVVVVPATADLMARAASGMADDLLTSTLLTARCPVVYAPAMHTEMWEHPATSANVATLRDRGALVIEPAEGRLTGVDTGRGRLPEPQAIVDIVLDVLEHPSGDLVGRRVLVSAGGTREPLDPVRFLGNRSSGRQGYAIATAAAARGADVTVVAGNVTLPDPAGADVVPVGSAAEMHEAMLKHAAKADVVVMAAAVADFRPVSYVDTKIKKTVDGSSPAIELERTPDILADLAANRPTSQQVVVGFAAETGDESGTVLEHARKKLAAKGCDLLVVNEVGGGRGFESADNEAVILGSDGSATSIQHGPKRVLAHRLLDAVLDRLA